MGKIGIVYYSRGGKTEKMAKFVYRGVAKLVKKLSKKER